MSLRVKKTGQRSIKLDTSRLNSQSFFAWRAYAAEKFHVVKPVPVKVMARRLPLLVKDQINNLVARRAELAVFNPDLFNTLPSISYTINRQLAGGDSF